MSISLQTIKPAKKPNKQEVKRPLTALIHSPPLIPENPPLIAIALPVNPAIRAWLSLVGIPKYQAITAHKTILKSAAESATEAEYVSLPKSTILATVTVTELFKILITPTPKKLNIADIIRADFSFIHLVTVTVEMAFGASVKPFTNTTASVKIIDVRVKVENCKTITPLLLDYLYSLFKAFPFNIYKT